MKRVRKPDYSRRPSKRETPIASIVCAFVIVVGAWFVSWWIVPLAALIVSAIWHGRTTIVRQVTWGAVAGWCVLLIVDSLHGRTWALARAAGGAVFLPWGLLFPATLLFAAGLAWGTATVVREVSVALHRQSA